MQESVFISVDLPAPFMPRIDNTSHFLTVNEIFLTSWVSTWFFVNSFVSIAIIYLPPFTLSEHCLGKIPVDSFLEQSLGHALHPQLQSRYHPVRFERFLVLFSG